MIKNLQTIDIFSKIHVSQPWNKTVRWNTTRDLPNSAKYRADAISASVQRMLLKSRTNARPPLLSCYYPQLSITELKTMAAIGIKRTVRRVRTD